MRTRTIQAQVIGACSDCINLGMDCKRHWSQFPIVRESGIPRALTVFFCQVYGFCAGRSSGHGPALEYEQQNNFRLEDPGLLR
jgi:hypothetical protein